MKYPDYVYESVCKRLDMTKDEIDDLPNDEVFEAIVAWKLGYIQWADTIKMWIKDIHKIELPN